MKTFALALVAMLALVSGGCVLNKDYVKADSLTFDAVAPEYLKYVDADATLDKDQKDRRHRTIETWKLRLSKTGGD